MKGVSLSMPVEKVKYGGWANCYRLFNDVVELIVTGDVGPRVIRFGFIGDENEFAEFEEQLGLIGGDEWRIYGGHRLWHAPEARPRTYAPDNEPVEVKVGENSLHVVQPTEKLTGIQKEMDIFLSPSGTHVTIVHRLINHNLWAVELSAWALSVMAQGGVAILPQPPFIPHEEKLLPARSMTVWHYTDMSDRRWRWGKKFILLRQDPSKPSPLKIGIANHEGWLAYSRHGHIFVKRHRHVEGAQYPDFGCSAEVFTNDRMLELETLSPLTRIEHGECVEHIEHWFLFKDVWIGEDEESIEETLRGVLEQTATVSFE
jgi:hypothetical protein